MDPSSIQSLHPRIAPRHPGNKAATLAGFFFRTRNINWNNGNIASLAWLS